MPFRRSHSQQDPCDVAAMSRMILLQAAPPIYGTAAFLALFAA
jgi:hypothetical protein